MFCRLVDADGVPANSSDARVETREVWARPKLRVIPSSSRARWISEFRGTHLADVAVGLGRGGLEGNALVLLNDGVGGVNAAKGEGGDGKDASVSGGS